MTKNKYHSSARMEAVQTPVIAIVADLISQNSGTISLGQGVVYYSPPASAIDCLPLLKDSIDIHKYGPTTGLPELQNIISEKLSIENHITIDNANRVVVTAGSNMAFLNLLFAISNPGDEIILTVPFYFNHEMAIKMLNCVPVPVSTDENYQLCPDRIRDSITEKTRAVVTISPNNPSGVVYPEGSLREVNSLCRKFGLYHISDEAYEYFTYNDVNHFSPGSIRASTEYTISIYSLSKAYGFASWRIGYMIIPGHLEKAVIKAQDTNLICPAIAAQYAAISALKTGRNYCMNKLKKIKKVREIVFQELECVDTLCRFPVSNGAFYLFLKINTEIKDMELMERLIREHQVAVIPGSPFGMTDNTYLRIAYGALDEKTASHGIKRFTNGISKIIQ